MKFIFHAMPTAFAQDCFGFKKTPCRPWRLYPDSVGAWREPFSKPNPATAGPATPKIIFSNQKRNPSRSWRPLREPSAFSLTEVVIAMGVAAVAFTTIIGLFPLGLDMSKESFESSQAALLAQTIMADMKDQQTGTGNKRTSTAPYNTKLIQVASNSDPIYVSNNYAVLRMDSLTPETAYVAYKVNTGIGNDTDTNNPLMLRPASGLVTATAPAWYSTGSNGCFALVKVTLSPTLRFGNTTSTSGARRVDISIETPGNAPATNRSFYQYTGVVRP